MPVPSGNRARAVVGGASTSRPGARKAHGAATARRTSPTAESRWAGLFQAAVGDVRRAVIAGLKQPSPRRMPGQTLGRRYIVPLQNSKLDLALPDALSFSPG